MSVSNQRTNMELLEEIQKLHNRIDDLEGSVAGRCQATKLLSDPENNSRAWLEYSPICTKILDLDFNLQYMSTAGVKALQIDDVTSLYGKPYPFDFFPKSFRELTIKNLQIALKTNETIEQEAPVVDVYGNVLWFNSTIVTVDNKKAGIKYIIVISEDLTEKRYAQVKLQASENKYRQLFDSMIEMFQVIELIYDNDGNVIDYIYLQVNPAFEKLVNKSKDELIGKRAKIIFGIVEEHWLKTYESVDKTGDPQNIENYGTELDKYYNIQSWKVCERQVAITFTDITERKNAEKKSAQLLQQNRDLTQRLYQIQEEERHHLARELHDEFSQCLTAIQLNTKCISQSSDILPSTILTSIKNIDDTTKRLHSDVRDMLTLLRPAFLEQQGLIASLNALVKHWDDQHPHVNYTISLVGLHNNLCDELNIALYRIIQEALTNVAKYAKATQVFILLNYRATEQPSPEMLYLTIKDNGVGMDTSNPTSGFGLLGMRERVMSLCGHFTLNSEPNNGLSIEIELPIESKNMV